MGSWSNFPNEIESLKCISISDLKRLGYLKPNIIWISGNIIWRNYYGEQTGSIGISINTSDDEGTLSFNYSCHGTHKINYTVQLITRPSNLGKGLLWFFVCPVTLTVCRKLHLHKGYFLHRTAFSDLYYEKQLRSKTYRELERIYGAYFNEGLYEQLYKKHSKKFYKGKPTKRYVRLMKKISGHEEIL